jgi:outer membrane protein OmpA-like peptidoglycan-associated protein
MDCSVADQLSQPRAPVAEVPIPNTKLFQNDLGGFAAVLFNFETGKADLLPDHQRFLVRHKDTFLNAPPTGGIVVQGSASRRGNQALNLTLSKNRAAAVTRYMKQILEVPESLFQSRDGFGAGVDPDPSFTENDARARNVFIVFRRANVDEAPDA